jgi:hypothetical protein
MLGETLMKRSLKLVLATAAATAALLGATSGAPVSAAPSEQTGPGDASIQTHCISYALHSHWYAYHVHLTNNCRAEQRVKVIISFGFDSPCFAINAFSSETHSYFVGSFDKLVNC